MGTLPGACGDEIGTEAVETMEAEEAAEVVEPAEGPREAAGMDCPAAFEGAACFPMAGFFLFGRYPSYLTIIKLFTLGGLINLDTSIFLWTR